MFLGILIFIELWTWKSTIKYHYVWIVEMCSIKTKTMYSESVWVLSFVFSMNFLSVIEVIVQLVCYSYTSTSAYIYTDIDIAYWHSMNIQRMKMTCVWDCSDSQPKLEFKQNFKIHTNMGVYAISNISYYIQVWFIHIQCIKISTLHIQNKSTSTHVCKHTYICLSSAFLTF